MLPSVHCQACGRADLEVFYEVDRVPVHSCLMVGSRAEAIDFPTGDLKLGFCETCGFIQNVAFDPAVHSYSTNYEETQGFSPRFRRFQTELCHKQAARYDLEGKRVLEIGCGKGEFLVELCEISGAHGIGVDPSYRPERTTSEAASRIEFIQDFYSDRYAHLTMDYVCCRHTLEHIQPVRDFVRMVRGTLNGRPDTIVFFEVPDVERVLLEQAFWDIYYEHCTYFTLGSLTRLFQASGFEVLDAYKGFDDQYLMIEARPAGVPQAADASDGSDVRRTERQVELFRGRIKEKLAVLRAQLDAIAASGERAVVWGSGSKAVSYLTTLGVTDEIEWIVDINPHKHGKFLAGTGHEIVSPGFLEQYRPDRVIIMNPIYLEEITADVHDMGLDPEFSAVQ
jgi:SAM-dependent methyltransferase